MFISCKNDNVGQASQHGVHAPENSDVDSTVMVQRWLHCGGKDSVDPVTL